MSTLRPTSTASYPVQSAYCPILNREFASITSKLGSLRSTQINSRILFAALFRYPRVAPALRPGCDAVQGNAA